MNISNFKQLELLLSEFMPSGIEMAYVLDRMLLFMDYLGNPQNSYPVVHVAGTSGKTSTCYYLASLLGQRYKKVGLTVSPHIVEVNERVQINLTPLPEKEFCSEFSIFMDLVESCSIKPTYFELLVGFAFWEFARQKVDYAVIEVGLGGLLDGTNVITRTDKVCVITDIGYDHINVLGRTLPEITSQKAGIIQPGNKVFCYKYGQKPAVIKVISDRTRLRRGELHLLNKLDLSGVEFLPDFQKRNFSLSYSVTECILGNNHIPKLTSSETSKAAKILIPGRMEIFEINGKTIILDGAHNSQKLHALMSSIASKYSKVPAAALISFVTGREYRLETSVSEIIGKVNFLIITSFETAQDFHHQSVKPKAVESLFNEQGFNNIQIVTDLKEALKTLLERPEKILIITGSFYLLCKIRPYVLEKSS
ncbi:MAG TPA: Mur ligase family protein [Candidatus Saccharimonadales bacterium]|nr:Mur ligase family protein [Candidatus Saccharimonadales bacterium]